jgi:hypothetical protein
MRYKKIKFVEKRKVIRMIEQADKKDESKGQLEDMLAYINNFPMHWKYVSLFAKNDDDTGFKETMVKVLKLAEAKKNKRETEMMEADLEDDSNSEVEREGADDKIFKKNVPKVDTFFIEDTGTASEKKPVEKRAVMRDGRIPKLAKNFEKL